jgi:4-nitrophenyl phosphatase
MSSSQINLLEKYDNFLIDLDGVMWNGHNAIEGSSEAVAYLKSQNKQVYFVTNNAALTREELQQRFSSMSITSSTENLYTTGYAILKYLQINHPSCQKIVVMGMPGLRKYLKDAGYQVVYPSELENPISDLKSLTKIEVEANVDAVVVAYDVNFDYYSALYCSACIQNGASLIGLNKDRFFIFGTSMIPASGCSISFIETASNKKANFIGKPLRFLFDIIREERNLDPERTLMIGDSMESDVLFGINSGIDTCLVLSGVTKEENLHGFEFRPNYVLENLAKVVG